MALSRQAVSSGSGRLRQKLRTRRALVEAAVALQRAGETITVPKVAEAAMVSVATAYRYFSSADYLDWEATESRSDFDGFVAESLSAVEAAGDSVLERWRTLVRGLGYRMFDDQVLFRRAAQKSLEQWFRRREGDDLPVRQGRRVAQIEAVVAPLRDELPAEAVERLTRALGVAFGPEAMISLVDAMRLDDDAAKAALDDAGRWMLLGVLSELRAANPAPQWVVPPGTID